MGPGLVGDDVPVLVGDAVSVVDWAVDDSSRSEARIWEIEFVVSCSGTVTVVAPSAVDLTIEVTIDGTMLGPSAGGLAEGVGSVVVVQVVTVIAEGSGSGTGSSVAIGRIVVASVVVKAVVTVTVGGGEYVTMETEMEVTVDTMVEMLTLVSVDMAVTVVMMVETSVETAVVVVVVVCGGTGRVEVSKTTSLGADDEGWSWPRARRTPIGTKIATRSARIHSMIPATEPQQALR